LLTFLIIGRVLKFKKEEAWAMKINKNQMILVADEDSKTIKTIKDMFIRIKDTTVLAAHSADIAIEMAWKKKPNIIIVNTTLVDLTGWEVLGILKKNDPTRSIPCIIMDTDGGIEDEVRALNAGADDYISKPFKSEVFLARIKAVLRRYLGHLSPRGSEFQEEVLRVGNIEMNMTTHSVCVNKKIISLTPKEFALLYLFIKKQNRVLNRVFLSGTIWEREYFETSQTIDRHIANLRRKLGPEGKRIETLHSIGYKFIGEETELSSN